MSVPDMRGCLFFIVICVYGAGWANAQTTFEIVDGRQGAPWVDLSSWVTRPAMQQASVAARAYWRAQDPAYEEEVRVLSVADGAFTRAEVAQQAVLYVMSLWPRCCPKMGLAIVEGDRLVRNVAFEGSAQALTPAPDLDGDGRDELFYTGSFGMGGEESGTLTFLRIEADSLSDRGSTSIYESSCASGREDSGSTAARVLALPGPSFTIERYALVSCDEAAWQLESGPEPLELDASSSSPYVELPVQ